MVIRLVRLRPSAEMPAYRTGGASGADLSACLDGVFCVYPYQDMVHIPTGLAMEIPSGWEGQVRPRSGLGAHITVELGTIDSDYRGEIHVMLRAKAEDGFTIHPGMRIAQLVIAPVVRATFVEATQLSATKRGTGGFGSTGQ